MSWVKTTVVITSLLLGPVIAVAIQKWQQRRIQPNHGYTYDRQIEERKQQCGICLKQMNSSEEVTLPCGHTFCSMCLTPLFNGTQTSCCECRRELDPDYLNLLKTKLMILPERTTKISRK